jgi:cytoskeletal protein CcmA (bactofilin family)
MESRNDTGSVESLDSFEATDPMRERTVFASSLVVEGDLSAVEDLLIEGEVHGRILLQGHSARIGKAGSVTGEVCAASIIVEANVTGQLYASERVVLIQSAHVQGEIIAPRVVLEDGCKFNGRIEVDAAATSAAIARTRRQITAALSGPDQTARQE